MRLRRVSLLVVVPLVLTLSTHDGASEPAVERASGSDSLGLLCELGITYALSGNHARAESVFIALLSRAPGDPRALNNLGNLRLWRGEPDLALAFYAHASSGDSADAGILLNEATALMLEGNDEAARERAGEGVRRAGGPEEAARLLGLQYPKGDDARREADRAQLSRDEVLALLRAAIQAVPIDSISAAEPEAKSAKTRKAIPPWRPAAARGSAGTEVTSVVYWKR